MPAFSNLFFRLPRLTFLAIGFILMLGVTSLINLPRQEDPTMTERFGFIETFLPGASATRVEALITEKVENALRAVPEVKTISSTSRAGHSLIQTELYDSVGKDQVELIWSEVRDELSDVEASLPDAASAPNLDVKMPVAVTLGIAISGTDVPFSVLERIATELKTRLSTLAYTRETKLYGEPSQEILIEVDQNALARLNISLPELGSLIRSSDTKLAAGEFNSNANSLIVEVKDEFASVERISAIPLRTNNGQFLRLSDLATVSKRYLDPPDAIAILNGQRGILVTTTMESGRRVDNWVATAKTIVDEYASELPAMVELEYIIDQNIYTTERLSTLLQNLLMSIALVLIALFFLMGYRSALIIGAALPLTLAMVLTGLQYMDIPLHQMSVTGLIIALGLLIDNAIVVVEEYKIQRRRGKSHADAIADAIQHLFVPLLASTATTAFAFLPIALTPGGVGDFTGAMAVAVVLSVTASFFLSMTIIPSIAGLVDRRFPQPNDEKTLSRWYISGISPKHLSRYYRTSIALILRKPTVGILISLILPICGFLVVGTMTTSFFPPVDRNQFQVQLTMPANTSLEKTLAKVDEIKRYVDAVPEFIDSQWFVGEGSPAVYYNMLGNSDGIASFASGFITTAHVDDPRDLLPSFQHELMAAFPEARIMALPFEQGPPFSAPIEIRIVGPDLKILKQLGDQIRMLLSKTRDVTYTTATLAASTPQVSIYPNENMNRLLGLSNADLPTQLSNELSGLMAGTIMEGSTEIPIRIKLDKQNQTSLAQLSVLSLIGSGNGTGNSNNPAQAVGSEINFGGIPLEQLAEVRLEPSPSRIDRYQNERINTVSGFLLPYAYPSLAVEDFRNRMDERNLTLPKGYRLEFGGEEEQRGEAVSNIMASFLTFLGLMIAVIVLSLNSFRYAGIIGLVGFLSIGLALLGVWMSGYPLGYTSLIGTLGLVGLAINGAIIVLSALRANESAMNGDLKTSEDIVVESSRHIISTTITTIGGFIPLILFGGHFWPPLAMAIAGGVTGSAILALYLVPALFSFITVRQKALNLKALEQGILNQGTPSSAAQPN